MTSFSDFVANTPAPASTAPAPGLLSRIGSGVGNYLSGIKNTVSSNVNEASNAVNNSGAGTENPFVAGATVFKDLAGSLASPITQAVAPVLNATGVSSSLNNIGQGFVNSPVGQGVTDALSKFPQASGAGADVFQGALDTATVAGGVGSMESSLGNIWEKVYGGGSKDTVATRTADATPAYNKDLIGQNTKTPAGEIVPRVNEGTGLTGKRTVNTSAAEAEQGKELANLPNYPDQGTALQKSLAVGKGISTEAENMRAGLQAEDKATPLNAKAEITKVQNLVKSNLPEEIHTKLGVVTPEEESMLKGMNAKIGQPNASTDLTTPFDHTVLPKTATGRYYGKVLDAVREYNGTREGKLDLRQKIEKAYQSEGGKYAYGSDSHNALAETNADIRNGLNKDLADTTKNTDTKASLQKQTNLYRAKDTLEAKSRTEAASTIGRFFQNHPILHRLATRDFMRFAATATGASLLTSYINKTLKGL